MGKKCEDEKEGTMNMMGSDREDEASPGKQVDLEDNSKESDDDADYGCAFCTKSEGVNTGHMLGQNGEDNTDVSTSSFSEERAYVIHKCSVGLDSMSCVDVFGERRLLTKLEQSQVVYESCATWEQSW